MMYSLLAAQDDRLPVHVFAGEATWLDAEVVVLREHESNGTSKWGLCEKRVSAVFGSPGRTWKACASYYRDNFLVGAAGEAVQVKKSTAMRKARRPRRHRIARPASLFRRRPSANEIAC